LHQNFNVVILKFTVGIDIGGTNTKLGLVDLNGNLLKRVNFSTHSHLNFIDYRTLLNTAFEEVIREITVSDLLGVGLGVPGANGKTGNVPAAANIPFLSALPLKNSLESFWNLPVFVAKDANAAALGEMLFGSAQGLENFILLTLGTGLGSGLVLNGKLISGANGLAAEYGHSLLVKNGRHCNCGQRGCFETYVSATGLKRTTLFFLSNANNISILRDIPPSQLNAQKIAEAAAQGDEIAKKAINQTAKWLGLKMVDLVVLTDPEAIILAGGLTNIGDYFLQIARDSLESNVLPMYKGKVKVDYSSLGSDEAAIIGAASLVLQQKW
jgi:glucokinase